ncbi:MAG: type II toxin-antitoxin system ParD family antitoxin [Caulobacteraceae bacterium]
MTIVFPEPMANQIRSAVEAGEYASTSEAVRDAVRLWTARRRLQEAELQGLREAWSEGKASGSKGALNMKSLIAEARADKAAKT